MQTLRFSTALAVAFSAFAAVQGAGSSSGSSGDAAVGSGSESLLELLHEVQDAVAADPALTKMFNITDASKMSEDELEELLRDIMDVSSVSASASASAGTGSEVAGSASVEDNSTADAPAAASGNAAQSAHGASALATVAILAGASLASAVFM